MTAVKTGIASLHIKSEFNKLHKLQFEETKLCHPSSNFDVKLNILS